MDHLAQIVLKHPQRWIIPALVMTTLSLAYLPFYKPAWNARQAMMVRDETGSHSNHPGRFTTAEDLKNAQETILELATSPSVVAAALSELGPAKPGNHPEKWPTPEDVESGRQSISMTPPNGAEFGTTELFYLNVRDTDRQRAIQFTSTLTDQFEIRLKQLRNVRAQSVLNELTDIVQLARQELDKTTGRLTTMETSFGGDLAELRALNQSSSGQSDLQSTLIEVRQELRHAETARLTNGQLLQFLQAAREDPTNLIATPNQLLDAQPALRRLKEGLVDAQISSSQLLGTMSAIHPRVLAAQVAEQEIRGHLRRELKLAVRGLGAEQQMINARIDSLSNKVDKLQERLKRLASTRAEYGNLVAESRQCTTNLTEAQQDLIDARATHAAAQSSSLVTTIDMPQTGPRPTGPGKSIIVAAGSFGGLLIGLGIAFLTTAPPTSVRQAQLNEPIPTPPPLAIPVTQPQQPQQPHTNRSDQPVATRPISVPAYQPAPVQPIVAPTYQPTADHSAWTSTDVLADASAKTLTLKEALAHCTENP